MENSAPRQPSILRSAVVTILLLLTTRVQAAEPVFSGSVDPPDQALSLWYTRPAAEWLEALPVGNGRLGGMVYGGVTTERIALNEDTLWSGGPKDCDNPEALKTLPEIRRLIFEGKYAEAHQLGKKMMGPYTQTYLPMGDLVLSFDIPRSPTAAESTTTAACWIWIAASPAFAMRLTESSIPGMCSSRNPIRSWSFGSRPAGRERSASPPGWVASSISGPKPKDNVLVLRGKAPAHVDPSYYNRRNPIIYAKTDDGEGMDFECQLRGSIDAGTLTVKDNAMTVEHAGSVTLLLSAATSFNGYNRSPGRQGNDPAPIAAGRLVGAARKPFDELLRAHVADHQRLFRRVSLDLGPTPVEARKLPTDQRVRQFGARDPGLVALHAQYGRYLLIASSRPGTQPPNLQGIWNDELRAPWSSNWTININTEMNMWPAETTNLAECHEPLFDLIQGLAENGRKTARTNYGCGGWVAHHNTDLWRQSAPVGDYGDGDSTWALWPMSGPWLCQHLWQHYEFGGDKVFLRDTAYPLMKGAAEFCLDFLIDDGKGHLVTAPSTSPENNFVTPDRQAFRGEHGQLDGPGADS